MALEAGVQNSFGCKKKSSFKLSSVVCHSLKSTAVSRWTERERQRVGGREGRGRAYRNKRTHKRTPMKETERQRQRDREGEIPTTVLPGQTGGLKLSPTTSFSIRIKPNKVARMACAYACAGASVRVRGSGRGRGRGEKNVRELARTEEEEARVGSWCRLLVLLVLLAYFICRRTSRTHQRLPGWYRRRCSRAHPVVALPQ